MALQSAYRDPLAAKTLDAEETRTVSLLDHSRDPANTLSVTPALYNKILLSSATGKIANRFLNEMQPDEQQRAICVLFSEILLQLPTSLQPPLSEGLYSKEPSLLTDKLIIPKCSIPTHKLQYGYSFSAASMHTEHCLLSTKAVIGFIE